MSSKVVYVVIIIVVALVAGFVLKRAIFAESFDWPTSGQKSLEKVSVADGETEEIMITGGYRHSVLLEEIVGGGPEKDGIPSIDDPKFVDVREAEDYLDDTEPGISLTIGDTTRFYPFQILVWHEIVNDTIDGKRVMVTFCPLCLTGVVFDPIVSGERVEFGTSGKLWNSNLVMYDRKTDSLWSQVLGEAIAGEKTGTKLGIIPWDQMKFGIWKQKYPNGEVLSRDTGATKFYGIDPYGDYYTNDKLLYSRVNNRDDRLIEKDNILGIVINGKPKAYLVDAVRAAGGVEDDFSGEKIFLEYDKELDAIRIFRNNKDGEKERINPIPSFWFSWVAIYPNTELYK
ncbi:MAG: hypothetical protein COT91_01270 [Candidatus Doudnabacteria bacterium CG10_big_fil_rev_8_21_14_0_10_41_10]|uniref:DUF3179 domain-containing protein n=1 Tax=Candidatus Doudnabacteria bacterium CG10_big_fil_rev_8_21_14_0_10_41_10 TaxID=1974551 RepID=A0A2H0VEJ5_9BACT|nr:MAG: hypothetical protein COT91_01270 [Candidatus Doudnabacteria bacterium CG10_big_fil_rev_8_21_14_0_10_41_10]